MISQTTIDSTTIDNVCKQCDTIIEVTMHAKKYLESVQSQLAGLNDDRNALLVEIKKLREEKDLGSATGQSIIKPSTTTMESETVPDTVTEKNLEPVSQLRTAGADVDTKTEKVFNQFEEDESLPFDMDINCNDDSSMANSDDGAAVGGCSTDVSDMENEQSETQVSMLTTCTVPVQKQSVVRAKRRQSKFMSPKKWRRMIRTHRLKSFLAAV